MKVNIKWERNMDKEGSIGLTIRLMKENFKITIYMVKANTYGQMEENLLVIGKIIKWTAMENLNGQMEENIAEII